MVWSGNGVTYTISIHALREESDQSRPAGRLRPQISIHALREESDPAKRLGGSVPKNFNPRPPRGERPTSSIEEAIE